MISTETLHEIFLRRDLDNKHRIDAIENRILQIEAQLELMIKLLRENG